MHCTELGTQCCGEGVQLQGEVVGRPLIGTRLFGLESHPEEKFGWLPIHEILMETALVEGPLIIPPGGFYGLVVVCGGIRSL